jgi:hypothetical protein
VAGPVIQATARSDFEDSMVWLTDDFVSGYSYHVCVRTGLTDHRKQTKFQIQRPTDVETPTCSFFKQVGNPTSTTSHPYMCTCFFRGGGGSAISGGGG